MNKRRSASFAPAHGAAKEVEAPWACWQPAAGLTDGPHCWRRYASSSDESENSTLDCEAGAFVLAALRIAWSFAERSLKILINSCDFSQTPILFCLVPKIPVEPKPGPRRVIRPIPTYFTLHVGVFMVGCVYIPHVLYRIALAYP